MIGDITKNLRRVQKELGFLFIDTDHDSETIKWIIDKVFPRCRKGALIGIHDWAVEEKDGKLIGKGADGVGGWDETNYLIDLIEKGELPLKKLYWTYEDDPTIETGFWLYDPQ